MNVTAWRDASYTEPGLLRAAVLALLVHIIFFAFMVFGLSWKNDPPETMIVDLWSDLPQPIKPAPARGASSRTEPVRQPPTKAKSEPVKETLPKSESIKADVPSPSQKPITEIKEKTVKSQPMKQAAKQPEPIKETPKPEPIKADAPSPSQKPAIEIKEKTVKPQPTKQAAKQPEPIKETPKPEPIETDAPSPSPKPTTEIKEKTVKPQPTKQAAKQPEPVKEIPPKAEPIKEKLTQSEVAKETTKETTKEAPKKSDLEKEKQLKEQQQAEEIKRQQQREQEAAAQKAAAEKTRQMDEIAKYKAMIQAKIRSRIVMPPNLPGNPIAEYRVTLLPGGEVLNVVLRRTSGYAAFDEAVERAIFLSTPLPIPPDVTLFREFRDFNLTVHYRESL
ncbi:cell envelope integrity protein TolA [Nitrosomonas sp. Nm34]|uniref:cell envelope integrity protein TolA n=1 Tax=Nitrosomonas sp. Nm34 TaxID=1881055 RepID=UPI0008E2ADA7|nr:cell envelope integrity protein TolA [Nitrosomonas sp. Nm34]SFI78628.1 colicin import membrane protein [Nitrosomonas sp. Nm34]